jgi:tRNA pseudouridine55 synthase
MDGILLVDKPPGITSAGAVAVVKRAVRPSKVGHLGTLDPFASGLLPLAIGEATKIATYLAGADKGYCGTVRLGILTDTLDSTGKVVAETPVPQLAQVDLASLAERFLGPIDQIPPEFSAIKQGGVPMYRLARRGQAPAMVARRVVLYELRLEAQGADRLAIEVRCSKGTYVRSLARDIGIALDCAAHLESLRRTSFGQFDLAQAVPLDQLRSEFSRETVLARTIDPLTALAALRRLAVDPTSAQRLRAGQQGALLPLSPPIATDERACVVDGEGGLVAVIAEAAGRWRIDRVFADRTRLAR